MPTFSVFDNRVSFLLKQNFSVDTSHPEYLGSPDIDSFRAECFEKGITPEASARVEAAWIEENYPEWIKLP